MNKCARIGETMTWVIATIIIVVLLVVSVVITSIVGLAKGDFASGMKREHYIIPSKSFSGFLLTPDLNASGKNIFEKLEEDEEFVELNGVNGKLASQIFNNFYDEDFYEIWVGIMTKGVGVYKKNDYFGSYGKIVAWESQGDRLCSRTTFDLKENEKWIKLDLCD